MRSLSGIVASKYQHTPDYNIFSPSTVYYTRLYTFLYMFCVLPSPSIFQNTKKMIKTITRNLFSIPDKFMFTLIDIVPLIFSFSSFFFSIVSLFRNHPCPSSISYLILIVLMVFLLRYRDTILFLSLFFPFILKTYSPY